MYKIINYVPLLCLLVCFGACSQENEDVITEPTSKTPAKHHFAPLSEFEKVKLSQYLNDSVSIRGLYEKSCKNGNKESCDVFKWTYAPLYKIWGANAHKASEQKQAQKAYMNQLIDEYRATCGDDRDMLTLITKNSFTSESAHHIALNWKDTNYSQSCVSLAHRLNAVAHYDFRFKNPPSYAIKEAALSNLSACLKHNNITSCLFAQNLSFAGGPDTLAFLPPLNLNIAYLASEQGKILSLERLEQIAALQSLDSDTIQEKQYFLFNLALLYKNDLRNLERAFYKSTREYCEECLEIEYKAQDEVMAQTTQDFIHISCEKGEECRNESVYSRWFKRHFKCCYYNDNGVKYPLEDKCAAILERTEPQVRELITSTLPKINAAYKSYQLALETSKEYFAKACEAGMQDLYCERLEYLNIGEPYWELPEEGVCPPIKLLDKTLQPN